MKKVFESCRLINSFHATCLFLHPLKTRVFLMFSGGIESDRGMNYVNRLIGIIYPTDILMCLGIFPKFRF